MMFVYLCVAMCGPVPSISGRALLEDDGCCDSYDVCGLETPQSLNSGPTVSVSRIYNSGKSERFVFSGADSSYCLPDASELENVKVLEAQDCSFEELPGLITTLPNLESISIVRGCLKLLPDAMANLVLLRWLDLSSNSISEVPQNIGNLKSLTYINLRNNRLRWLPPTFWNFRNKKVWLYLEGNNIVEKGNGIYLGKEELKEIFDRKVFFNDLPSPQP